MVSAEAQGARAQEKSPPQRIQGTDGTRGTISHAPLEDCRWEYVRSGLLSPEFFECYAFAWAQTLLAHGIASRNDWVVLGHDGRDPSGTFEQAAIAGIRKSGLGVLKVGMLPTPAVALYMLAQKAQGSIMLTASHNPADQHGIKLFHTKTGLKYSLLDDHKITAALFAVDTTWLATAPLLGAEQDQHPAALQLYTQLQQNILLDMLEPQRLEDFVILTDSANGASSLCMPHIFPELQGGVPAVHTHTDPSAPINHNCGVADLEGVKTIARTDISPGGTFAQHQALHEFFALATKAQNAGKRPIGFVFDGDGDRCYMLAYCAKSDRIRVFSGDDLAALLLQHAATAAVPLVLYNTIESDLAINVLAQQQGVDTHTTPVGDKFILAAIWQSLLGEDYADYFTRGDFLSLTAALSWTEVHTLAGRPLPNAIGYEESGHFIAPVCSDQHDSPILFVGGNGAMAASLALAALADQALANLPKQPPASDYQPFFAKSIAIYGVDKSVLESKQNCLVAIQAACERLYAARGLPQAKRITYSEDRAMLFWEFYEGAKPVARIFIRNSGTEDKLSINLRCEPQLSGAFLEALGAVHLELYQKTRLLSCDRRTAIACLKAVDTRGVRNPHEAREAQENTPKILQEHQGIALRLELKEGLLQGGMLTASGRAILAFEEQKSETPRAAE